jgi:hypothetical protein
MANAVMARLAATVTFLGQRQRNLFTVSRRSVYPSAANSGNSGGDPGTMDGMPIE